VCSALPEPGPAAGIFFSEGPEPAWRAEEEGAGTAITAPRVRRVVIICTRAFII